MKKKYNVLLVDDHPLITSAYKKVFDLIQEQNSGLSFDVFEANSLQDAKYHINRFNEKRLLDLLFVDLKLPPLPEQKLFSGDDLALEIKRDFPEVKIVIATTIYHNYRIHGIFKSLDPQGFLVKGDIDEEEIGTAIINLLKDTTYYSKTVRNSMRLHITNDLMLDQLDRRILYELSQGTKTKDLSKLLPLSSAGIDRRKKMLKEVLNLEEKDDKSLLQKARDLGFL